MKKIIIPVIFAFLSACSTDSGSGVLGGSVKNIANKISNVTSNLAPDSLKNAKSSFTKEDPPDFYEPQPDLVRLYLNTMVTFMEIAAGAFDEMSTHLNDVPNGTGTETVTIGGDEAGTYSIEYNKTDVNNFSFLIFQAEDKKRTAALIAVKSVNGNTFTIYVNTAIIDDDKSSKAHSPIVKAEITYVSENSWNAKLSLSDRICGNGDPAGDGHEPKNLVFYLAYDGSAWKGFGEEYSPRFADQSPVCSDWTAAAEILDAKAGIMISRFVATDLKVKAEVAVFLRTYAVAPIPESGFVTYALNKADTTYNTVSPGFPTDSGRNASYYANPFCIDAPGEAVGNINWNDNCGITTSFPSTSLMTSVAGMRDLDISMPDDVNNIP
jgi:hypothetical protein